MKTGLDRKAVERILARAAELHTRETSTDVSDAISETQMLEIAKEVGLPSETVKQALAEEKTRIEVDTDGSWLERIAGPAFVSATRTVEGTPTQTLDRLDQWMQHEESLRIQRRYGTRIVWEPRQDLVGILRRNIGGGRRSYHLARAKTISGTVIAVDDHRTLIRLDADVVASRSRHIGWGTVFGTSGLTVSGVLAALGTVMPPGLALAAFSAALVPIPVATFGVYLTMKHQQTLAGRMKTELEQILDHFEFPHMKKSPSLLETIAGRPLLR